MSGDKGLDYICENWNKLKSLYNSKGYVVMGVTSGKLYFHRNCFERAVHAANTLLDSGPVHESFIYLNLMFDKPSFV